MIKLIKTTGGIMQTVLGKPACPFLGKNPVPHVTISKRGGGIDSSCSSGRVGKVGRAAKFSENFIGAGFCDG